MRSELMIAPPVIEDVATQKARAVTIRADARRRWERACRLVEDSRVLYERLHRG